MLPVFSKQNVRFYPSYLRKEDKTENVSTSTQSIAEPEITTDIRSNLLRFMNKTKSNQSKEIDKTLNFNLSSKEDCEINAFTHKFDELDDVFINKKSSSSSEENYFMNEENTQLSQAIEPPNILSEELSHQFPNFKFSRLSRTSKRSSSSALDDNLENYQLPNKFVGFKWQKLGGQFKQLMCPEISNSSFKDQVNEEIICPTKQRLIVSESTLIDGECNGDFCKFLTNDEEEYLPDYLQSSFLNTNAFISNSNTLRDIYKNSKTASLISLDENTINDQINIVKHSNNISNNNAIVSDSAQNIEKSAPICGNPGYFNDQINLGKHFNNISKDNAMVSDGAKSTPICGDPGYFNFDTYMDQVLMNSNDYFHAKQYNSFSAGATRFAYPLRRSLYLNQSESCKHSSFETLLLVNDYKNYRLPDTGNKAENDSGLSIPVNSTDNILNLTCLNKNLKRCRSFSLNDLTCLNRSVFRTGGMFYDDYLSAKDIPNSLERHNIINTQSTKQLNACQMSLDINKGHSPSSEDAHKKSLSSIGVDNITVDLHERQWGICPEASQDLSLNNSASGSVKSKAESQRSSQSTSSHQNSNQPMETISPSDCQASSSANSSLTRNFLSQITLNQSSSESPESSHSSSLRNSIRRYSLSDTALSYETNSRSSGNWYYYDAGLRASEPESNRRGLIIDLYRYIRENSRPITEPIRPPAYEEIVSQPATQLPDSPPPTFEDSQLPLYENQEIFPSFQRTLAQNGPSHNGAFLQGVLLAASQSANNESRLDVGGDPEPFLFLPVAPSDDGESSNIVEENGASDDNFINNGSCGEEQSSGLSRSEDEETSKDSGEEELETSTDDQDEINADPQPIDCQEYIRSDAAESSGGVEIIEDQPPSYRDLFAMDADDLYPALDHAIGDWGVFGVGLENAATLNDLGHMGFPRQLQSRPAVRWNVNLGVDRWTSSSLWIR